MQKNCQFASTVCIAFEFASSGSCTVNNGPNTTNEVPNLALSTTDFIRSWNSRNLYSLTGLHFSIEFKTPSINLMRMIRQRRANWLHSAFLGDPNDSH